MNEFLIIAFDKLCTIGHAVCGYIATNNIALIGIIVGVIAAVYARLSYRFQIKPPVLKAVAVVSGDWPTATVTITNTGDDHFSIGRIGFDVNGDGVRIEFPAIEPAGKYKFPYLLIRRAGIKVTFNVRAIDTIPINVGTRIVLELSEGTNLICDGSVLANVDERTIAR